jgi:plasmid replication initiation protein
MMQFNSTGVCKTIFNGIEKILLLEDKYSQTKDLRKWVIEPAIKEIREKTSFFIEHKLIKQVKDTHIWN